MTNEQTPQGLRLGSLIDGKYNCESRTRWNVYCLASDEYQN